jgi:hypothetical protein
MTEDGVGQLWHRRLRVACSGIPQSLSYCKSTNSAVCNTAELGGLGGLFGLQAESFGGPDTMLVGDTEDVWEGCRRAFLRRQFEIVNNNKEISIPTLRLNLTFAFRKDW